jgi:hypothetical protein
VAGRRWSSNRWSSTGCSNARTAARAPRRRCCARTPPWFASAARRPELDALHAWCAAEGARTSELFCLATTLLDPRTAPIDEIPALYHDRWSAETLLAAVKTDLRGGPDVLLRSQHPDGVHQERWASQANPADIVQTARLLRGEQLEVTWTEVTLTIGAPDQLPPADMTEVMLMARSTRSSSSGRSSRGRGRTRTSRSAVTATLMTLRAPASRSAVRGTHARRSTRCSRTGCSSR